MHNYYYLMKTVCNYLQTVTIIKNLPWQNKYYFGMHRG